MPLSLHSLEPATGRALVFNEMSRVEVQDKEGPALRGF